MSIWNFYAQLSWARENVYNLVARYFIDQK